MNNEPILNEPNKTKKLPRSIGILAIVGLGIAVVQGINDNNNDRLYYGDLTCQGRQQINVEASQTTAEVISDNLHLVNGSDKFSDQQKTDFEYILIKEVGELAKLYQNNQETVLRFRESGTISIPAQCN